MKSSYPLQVTAAEWLAAVKHNQQAYTRQLLHPAMRLVNALLYGVVGCLLVVTELQLLQQRGLGDLHWLVWAGPAFVLGAYLLQRSMFTWRMQRILPQLGVAVLGPQVLELADTGIWINSAERRKFTAYRAIVDIVSVPGASLLYEDAIHSVVVPDTAFADAVERDAFLALLRQRIALSGGQLATPPAAGGVAVESALGEVTVWGLLVQGLRGLLFLKPKAMPGELRWSQFFGLFALLLLMHNGFALLYQGREAVYNANAWPGALFSLPLMLFAAWAVAATQGKQERTLALAASWYALFLPLVLLSWLLFLLGQSGHIAGWNDKWDAWTYYAWSSWFVLSAVVFAIRLLGTPLKQFLLPLLLTVLLLWAPIQLLYWGQTLWEQAAPPPEEEQADAGPDPAMEDYFYQQPKLLEQAVLGLKPRVPGRSNLFFLTAAGFASQDVFMREALTIQSQFDQRFGTEGHSLALVNNPATLQQLPIASATSLRLALKRMGQLMDKDQDILFLYLTSHGSADHKLAVEFGPMQFNDVDPQVLRQLLDESGIKHRVVVVSACYSGGFIAPLKNDDTLVVTAAAADKVSFGCSNEADFTYFGRAYFVDALRQTDSFVDAFELARQAVAKREQQDGFEASDPQVAIGSRIKATLQRWDAQRKAAAAGALPG